MKGLGFAKKIQRLLAAAVAAALTSTTLPAFAVKAEDNIVSLRIDAAEFDINNIGADRLVSVNVNVNGNENGFLAAEFGINYDRRLTFVDASAVSIAGEAFSYAYNEENDLIWFSGASAMGTELASSGKSTLFTLTFQLPENYQSNDQYPIHFSWQNIAQNSAFWYVDRGVNVFEELKDNSRDGYIWIPSSDSARLSATELRINTGESKQLEILNYDGNAFWISSNEDVATVENGVVTAKAPGTCTIQCIANVFLTCDIEVPVYFTYMLDPDVNDPIVISSPSVVVYLEYPESDGMVTWLSTSNSVATVENGCVKPLKEGTTNIIAACDDLILSRQIIVQYAGSSDDPPIEVPPEPSTEPTTEAITETEPPTEPTTEPVPELFIGDLDGNQTIEILDVLTLNRNLLGLELLSDAQRKAADVYQDGKVDATDSLWLLKKVVQLVDELPVIPD